MARPSTKVSAQQDYKNIFLKIGKRINRDIIRDKIYLPY